MNDFDLDKFEPSDDEANLYGNIEPALTAIVDALSEVNLSSSMQPALTAMADALSEVNLSSSMQPALTAITEAVSQIKIPNPEAMRSFINSVQTTNRSFSYPFNSVDTIRMFETLKSFQLFQSEINSHSCHEQETFPTTISDDEIKDWIQDEDYIKNVSIAYKNFHFFKKHFNELFHKAHSYISESQKEIVRFGYTNAFAYLISLLSYINPLFPFFIFSLIGTTGLILPKPKEATQPPNSQSEESD